LVFVTSFHQTYERTSAWAKRPSSRGLQDDALHALKIQSMGVTWHPVLAMLVDSGDLSNWPICFLKNVGKMGKLDEN